MAGGDGAVATDDEFQLTALFSYQAKTSEQLSVLRGERLMVHSTSGGWSVVSTVSGGSGIVPCTVVGIEDASDADDARVSTITAHGGCVASYGNVWVTDFAEKDVSLLILVAKSVTSVALR